METHMIFETHAHYDDEAFEQDREALLNSMEAHGIGHIVNACASIESLKATEELMEKYPFVYAICQRQLRSERLDWIITGIKKNGNMRFRRRCFAHRWRLPERKKCRL